jgi:hypothetical protein
MKDAIAFVIDMINRENACKDAIAFTRENHTPIKRLCQGFS